VNPPHDGFRYEPLLWAAEPRSTLEQDPGLGAHLLMIYFRNPSSARNSRKNFEHLLGTVAGVVLAHNPFVAQPPPLHSVVQDDPNQEKTTFARTR